MKREEKSQQSKILILETSIKEFAAQGFEKASINTICADGRISKGRLYNYFKSKDDIFIKSASYIFNKRLEHIKNFTVNENENLINVLQRLFRYKQQYFLDNPNHGSFLHIVIESAPKHLYEPCFELLEQYNEEIYKFNSDIFHKINPEISDKYIRLINKIIGIASDSTNFRTAELRQSSQAEKISLFEKKAAEFDETIQILFFGIIPR